MNDMQKLNFGEISAESERAENPELITSGFIDINSVEKRAVDGKEFLFLGYKGSGKSSIGERIELICDESFDRIVSKIYLNEFPYTPFSKIIKGDVEPEAKFPAAWSWILLIYVLESFEKDAGATYSDRNLFDQAIKEFRDLGISPGSSPASIVRKSSKNNLSFKLPYNLVGYETGNGDVKSSDEIFNFVHILKSIVGGIKSNSKHYLIIDGLDEMLSSRGSQYKSLYALINEVSSLNNMFLKDNVPFKIILLCRTDLFEKTPGPNKNKIRQAHGIELDWFHDPNDPDKSLLLKAAYLRAKISLGRDTDVFTEFFPTTIHKTPIKQYLLDMTRHTPRDFLQLLNYIVRTTKDSHLTVENVKSGFREYSIKYFYPEIQDELSGYADVDEISHTIQAIGRVGKRDLSFRELFLEMKIEYDKITEIRLSEICSTLFNCSAIGNISDVRGHTHYSFKFRNRISTFTRSKRIMLHRGLWKAMNIV